MQKLNNEINSLLQILETKLSTSEMQRVKDLVDKLLKKSKCNGACFSDVEIEELPLYLRSDIAE